MHSSAALITKIFLFLASIILCVLFVLGWKTIRTADRIHIDNHRDEPSENNAFFDGKEGRMSLSGEAEGRINILLFGRAGETYPGKNLTDTVMLASIDTKNRRVGFLSLPRDLYVPIPGTGLFTKLNSVYQHSLLGGHGADKAVAAVEEITGQEIPYYVILDFDGFERIIDDIGGIRIFSERDILDTRYPGKNYSYETFELPSGWHTLDGKTALKYARERHSDPEGDFGRAKRQQQIIKAAQEKILSTETLLNPFTISRLLETLGESVRTNLSLPEIMSFSELAKTIDLRNAGTVVVDAWKKESLLRVSHIDLGGTRAFILVPRSGSWSEVQAQAEHLFEEGALRDRLERIRQEEATLLVVSDPKNASFAQTFSRTLSEIFPVSATTMTTPLEKTGGSGIIDRTSLSKPYTLDSLKKTFSLETLDSAPILPPRIDLKPFDFVIVLSGNEARILPESEGTLYDRSEHDDGDPFQEVFPAQAKY